MPLTNAQKQKTYRERQKVKLGASYLDEDSLRKRKSRQKDLSATRRREAENKRRQRRRLRDATHVAPNDVVEKQVTGDMLVEFCEADIQDVFVQFSDRFKIRKLIHSFPRSAPDEVPEPLPPASLACPLQISNVLSQSHLEEHIKSEFTFDSVQTSTKMVSSSMSPSSVVSPHATSPSNPTSSHNRLSSSCYTAITLSDDDQDDTREASSLLNRYGDDTYPIKGRGSAVVTSGDNIQLLACTYSTPELLARKEHRGKPTEAQKLGQIILRDCARIVDIWESPPLFNTISIEKREQFFQHINQIAPQLMSSQRDVWLRLREALQNRRNYLLAKQERRKRSHDKNDHSGCEVKVHCHNSML